MNELMVIVLISAGSSSMVSIVLILLGVGPILGYGSGT